MASQPPILPYASTKPDPLLRCLLWVLLADLSLVLAGAGTGIAGDIYDHFHPMSWRGARVTSPIYNGLFLAAGLHWSVIIPMVVAAIVRRRRRAG